MYLAASRAGQGAGAVLGGGSLLLFVGVLPGSPPHPHPLMLEWRCHLPNGLHPHWHQYERVVTALANYLLPLSPHPRQIRQGGASIGIAEHGEGFKQWKPVDSDPGAVVF